MSTRFISKAAIVAELARMPGTHVTPATIKALIERLPSTPAKKPPARPSTKLSAPSAAPAPVAAAPAPASGGSAPESLSAEQIEVHKRANESAFALELARVDYDIHYADRAVTDFMKRARVPERSKNGTSWRPLTDADVASYAARMLDAAERESNGVSTPALRAALHVLCEKEPRLRSLYRSLRDSRLDDAAIVRAMRKRWAEVRGSK